MERDAGSKGSVWDEPRKPLDYTYANEPHDEQVSVWGAELAEAIEPWLKDFDSYDERLSFFAALELEIEAIAVAAHAAGMLRDASHSKLQAERGAEREVCARIARQFVANERLTGKTAELVERIAASIEVPF